MFGIGVGELIVILLIFGVMGVGMVFTLLVIVTVLRSNAPAPKLPDPASKQLDQDGTP